jgi:hypothetical protein
MKMASASNLNRKRRKRHQCQAKSNVEKRRIENNGQLNNGVAASMWQYLKSQRGGGNENRKRIQSSARWRNRHRQLKKMKENEENLK